MEKFVFYLWHCLTWTCIIFVNVVDPVAAVRIRTHPTNVTVLQGSDARFVCGVIDQRGGDYVFWKKVTRTGFTDVLSYNANSMNRTKYSIQDSYSMIVKDVELVDEAWYECQAGVDRSRAMLTVNVMMNNMTISWGNDPPFARDTLVNLTCHVTHSRPPADITWFHGQTELTTITSRCEQSSDLDGFGNSTSTLTVVIESEADTEPYRCVASLPNIDSKRTEVTYATRVDNTSGSVMTGSVGMLWTLIMVITAHAHLSTSLRHNN